MSSPRLEGQLSCLRPFAADDEPAFLSQVNYPEMFEFMKFRFGTTEAAGDAFAWLMDLQRRPDSQDLMYWAVEKLDDHAFVGWAGLARARPDKSDEIGWYLLPPFWRRGYGSDATALLLQYSFNVLGSKLVTATCDPDNIGSKRVLEKAAMTNEGLLPEPVQTWRGPRPRLSYALTVEAFRRLDASANS